MLVRVLIVSALALAIAGGTAQAQPRTPAFLDEAPAARVDTRHLQASIDGPVRLSDAGRAVVTLLVTPKPRMHVYAADVDGYVPFTVMAEPQPGVEAGKVTYPPSETYVFPPTGESSRVYMAPFRVTQALRVSSELRKKIVAGEAAGGVLVIRYQACDDAVCYRPTTETIAFDFAK